MCATVWRVLYYLIESVHNLYISGFIPLLFYCMFLRYDTIEEFNVDSKAEYTA